MRAKLGKVEGVSEAGVPWVSGDVTPRATAQRNVVALCAMAILARACEAGPVAAAACQKTHAVMATMAPQVWKQVLSTNATSPGDHVISSHMLEAKREPFDRLSATTGPPISS